MKRPIRIVGKRKRQGAKQGKGRQTLEKTKPARKGAEPAPRRDRDHNLLKKNKQFRGWA